MTYLPDVNVWIALAAERHTLHRAARHWFSNLQDEKLTFCRLTQLGFLRLLTNKHVMQEEVMRPSEAWEAYRVLRMDRRIGYLASVHRFGEVNAPSVNTRQPSIGPRNVRHEDPNEGWGELHCTKLMIV